VTFVLNRTSQNSFIEQRRKNKGNGRRLQREKKLWHVTPKNTRVNSLK